MDTNLIWGKPMDYITKKRCKKYFSWVETTFPWYQFSVKVVEKPAVRQEGPYLCIKTETFRVHGDNQKNMKIRKTNLTFEQSLPHHYPVFV